MFLIRAERSEGRRPECSEVSFKFSTFPSKKFVQFGVGKNRNFYWSVYHEKLGQFRVEKNINLYWSAYHEKLGQFRVEKNINFYWSAYHEKLGQFRVEIK